MSEDKVRVQTSDGAILEVALDVAKQWGPIQNMYEVFGTINTQDKPVELENVDKETLEKIMEWTNYHKKDLVPEETSDPSKKRTIELTDWDKKFFTVPNEMIFQIIMASNYLGVAELLDQGCKTVANMIKDKTPEQVRQTFNIPNDLPPFEDLPEAQTTTEQD